MPEVFERSGPGWQILRLPVAADSMPHGPLAADSTPRCPLPAYGREWHQRPRLRGGLRGL
ncbi:hypothetical protein J31TS4_14010 [Paenibacillus sp. J31TS4]|nr:hypothetical protein J31TS4_14010 [Paenibacillus sp. J31TS4]